MDKEGWQYQIYNQLDRPGGKFWWYEKEEQVHTVILMRPGISPILVPGPSMYVLIPILGLPRFLLLTKIYLNYVYILVFFIIAKIHLFGSKEKKIDWKSSKTRN